MKHPHTTTDERPKARGEAELRVTWVEGGGGNLFTDEDGEVHEGYLLLDTHGLDEGPDGRAVHLQHEESQRVDEVAHRLEGQLSRGA